jgi:hypothetical protein
MGNPKLTSGELAVLWGSYQNDTLGVCTISYFLNIVEDPEIRAILEYGLQLSIKHVQTVKNILEQEEHPMPFGFTEQDINKNAPRLFSDIFMLYYMSNLGSQGLQSYGMALPNSARKDIREFYTACLHSSAELFNRSVDLLEKLGIFIRPPYIPYTNQAEFVHKQHFLAGWLGEERILTTIEISFLFFNLQRNVLGSALLQDLAKWQMTRKFANIWSGERKSLGSTDLCLISFYQRLIYKFQCHGMLCRLVQQKHLFLVS